MASQTTRTEEDKPNSEVEDYLIGWAATTQLMHSGQSWSGNERNCAYLNLGDGHFADISAATGLDFLDDGRSVASTDWDGDGDLDFWLKNRTGPQLRFIRNNARSSNNFIAIDLVGRTVNRDAVGAKIVVTADGKKHTRILVAGDGYLSQSTKRLHFGLGEVGKITNVEVTWPDGSKQPIGPLGINKVWKIVQGQQPTEVDMRKSPTIESNPANQKENPPTRIVLKTPLVFPPTILKSLTIEDATGPTLVSLWAQWCKPCRNELEGFVKERELLESCGLRVVALNVDKPGDREKAIDLFGEIVKSEETNSIISNVEATEHEVSALSAILDHVRDKKAPDLPLPLSLLFSPDGQLQIVYLGPVMIPMLEQDAKTFGRNLVRPHLRRQFVGRWYYRVPRDYAGLSADLKDRGCEVEAEFYDEVLKAAPRQ